MRNPLTLLLSLAAFSHAQDFPTPSAPTHTPTHGAHAPSSTSKPSTTSTPNADVSTIGQDAPTLTSGDPLVYCYLVLIVGFFIAVALLYWVLVTRKQPASTRAASLVSWLSTGPHSARTRRRWRPSFFAFRREEGLDEHGEAPPPYRRTFLDPETGTKPPSYGCLEHFPDELPARPSPARSIARSRGASMARS